MAFPWANDVRFDWNGQYYDADFVANYFFNNPDDARIFEYIQWRRAFPGRQFEHDCDRCFILKLACDYRYANCPACEGAGLHCIRKTREVFPDLSGAWSGHYFPPPAPQAPQEPINLAPLQANPPPKEVHKTYPPILPPPRPDMPAPVNQPPPVNPRPENPNPQPILPPLRPILPPPRPILPAPVNPPPPANPFRRPILPPRPILPAPVNPPLPANPLHRPMLLPPQPLAHSGTNPQSSGSLPAYMKPRTRTIKALKCECCANRTALHRCDAKPQGNRPVGCTTCSSWGLPCVIHGQVFPPNMRNDPTLSRFAPCLNCSKNHRNCDRKRPCDSCFMRGEQELCQGKSYTGCFQRSVPGADLPLYYRRLGYGPNGVNDPPPPGPIPTIPADYHMQFLQAISGPVYEGENALLGTSQQPSVDPYTPPTAQPLDPAREGSLLSGFPPPAPGISYIPPGFPAPPNAPQAQAPLDPQLGPSGSAPGPSTQAPQDDDFDDLYDASPRRR
ncbi:hypothetical protein F4804DRAFT_353930 [Jackrogersella minutella]|nr:hypothetical protein F4804DRAFT_353930 [Jackrogersella minutella]